MFIFNLRNNVSQGRWVCMAKDLICGASLEEDKAGATFDYLENTYYFCSSTCRDRFAEATLAGINP
jgi:YHS domain-containing protein